MREIVAAIEASGDKSVVVINSMNNKVLVHWKTDRSYVVWNYDSRGNLSLGKYFKYHTTSGEVQACHDAYAQYCEYK